MPDPSTPVLVVVNGPPAAGKTTIARHLAEEAGLPLFGKDDFKDVLFDSLGVREREWSRRLGAAGVAVLFAVTRAELEAGRSIVIENAFVPRFDGGRFAQLSDRVPHRTVQVWCTTAVDILYDRFQARAGSGARHAGHVDHLLSRDDFEELLRDRGYAPLPLGGTLLEVDTTDFDAIDYGRLHAAVAGTEVP